MSERRVNESVDKPMRIEPKGYTPETILTAEEVAEWLGVSVRKIERMQLPCFYLGARTRRFLAKSVLEYVERLVA